MGFNHFGFGYIINFHKNFGFELGLNVGFQAFGYKYSFYGTDNEIAWYRNEDYILTVDFPYHLITRFNIHPNLLLFVEAGLNFRSHQKLTSEAIAIFLDSLNNPNTEFYMKTEYGTVNINLTYSMNAGVMICLKSKNLFKICFTSSIGHYQVIEGKYSYYDNGVEVSSGKYFSYGTYYGIEIGYIFTKMKNKL